MILTTLKLYMPNYSCTYDMMRLIASLVCQSNLMNSTNELFLFYQIELQIVAFNRVMKNQWSPCIES